jgi:hypothetical protein
VVATELAPKPATDRGQQGVESVFASSVVFYVNLDGFAYRLSDILHIVRGATAGIFCTISRQVICDQVVRVLGRRADRANADLVTEKIETSPVRETPVQEISPQPVVDETTTTVLECPICFLR